MEQIAGTAPVGDGTVDYSLAVSDGADSATTVTIARGGQSVLRATTRLRDDGSAIVEVTASDGGEQLRVLLEVTDQGDVRDIGGSSANVPIALLADDAGNLNPSDVRLYGATVPPLSGEWADAVHAAASQLRARIESEYAPQSGSKTCRAKCTATFAMEAALCSPLPPPANAICMTGVSGRYAHCFWKKCK